jgi:hypothetical protein
MTLLAKHVPPARRIVGQWIDDSLGRTLWIISFRDGAAYVSHGGAFEVELVGLGAQPFQQFERKEPSKAGDWYRINERGDLEVRDDHGLILVARRLDTR